MGRAFTSREQDRIYSFSLYYLMSSDFDLYLSLEKQIRNNFLAYEPYLIKLLVHEIDVLGINSARMLHKYASSKYESDNVLKILSNITESQKEDMFQILKLRLVDSQIFLHQKEDAIMKLGALNFLPSLEILKTFSEDPEPEIREILARSLGNLRSEHSNNLLYKLLLDENKQIHYTATKSLAKIMPGLYHHKIPQDILISLDSLKLLKLMPLRTFDSYIRRMWEKKGFSASIIEEYHQESNTNIIQGYWKCSLQGSNEMQIKSMNLILVSRMPNILTFIEDKLVLASDQNQKQNLKAMVFVIQRLVKIEKSDGFSIIL